MGGTIALSTEDGYIATGLLYAYGSAGYGGGTGGAIALSTQNGNITTALLHTYGIGCFGSTLNIYGAKTNLHSRQYRNHHDSVIWGTLFGKVRSCFPQIHAE